MKRHITVAALLALTLTVSCAKIEAENVNQPVTSISYSDEAIPGELLPNPYSMSIMGTAYRTLTGNDDLKPNCLYVRFLCENDEQIETLENAGIELYPYPLDRMIIQQGATYANSQGSGVWMYARTNTDIDFPGIRYEILDECYVPEDRPGTRAGLDPETLELEAIKIAGLDKYGMVPTKASAGSGCCPRGRVTAVTTDSGTSVPLRGVKVKCTFFLKSAWAYTDDNGCFTIDTKFSTSPGYSVIYENSRGFVMKDGLFTATHSFGSFPASGAELKVNGAGKAWKLATVNNSACDYHDFCNQEEITSPLQDLRIQCMSLSSSSSTPMLHRMFSERSSSMTSKLIAQIGLAISSLMPDIVIGLSGQNVYRSLYQDVWHELSHASHYMKTGQGLWTLVVSYTVKNKGYGKGQGDKDQVEACRLAEAWGHAMEKICMRRQFGSVMTTPQDREWFGCDIADIYELMKDGLVAPGEIYRCLTSDVTSMDHLKERLVKKYPSRAQEMQKRWRKNRE